MAEFEFQLGAGAAYLTPAFQPNADSLRAIPLGAEVVTIDLSGAVPGSKAVVALQWNEVARDSAIEYLDGGRFADTLFIYVDPKIIKDEYRKDADK